MRETNERRGNTVLWVVVGVLAFLLFVVAPAILLPAVQAAREAARRSQSKHNLKVLGVGLHNYHSVEKSFPSGATLGPDGERLHGAQTLLLPQLEQANLYSRIDLDQPWNAPVNRPTMQTPLRIYLNPGVAGSGMTPEGYAATHYAENVHCFPDGDGLPMRNMIDGLGSTLFMGEVGANFEPWGSPNNRRDPADGLNLSPDGFGSPFRGGATFLMGDGSVHFLNDDIDPKILEALATPAGDERIPLP